MNAGMIKLPRRLLSVTAGLLSIPLALFTLTLFFATGRPVPHTFIPAAQLDFQVLPSFASIPAPWIKPVVLNMNQDKTCILTAKGELKAQDQVLVNLASIGFSILDSISMQALFTFSFNDGHPPQFDLSLGRECLYVAPGDRLHVLVRKPKDAGYREIDGQWNEIKSQKIQEASGFSVAFSSSHLLIYTANEAVNYSLKDGTKVTEYSILPEWIVLKCFFNIQGHAKALVFRDPEGQAGRLEVRDLQTAALELTLDQSKFHELGIAEDELTSAKSRISPKNTLIATCPDTSNVLLIRSLESGFTKAICPNLTDKRWLGDFSPDDRYFLFSTSKQKSPFSKFAGWNQSFDDWHKQHFREKESGVLLDIKTGATWTDLIIGDRNIYAFSDDASRFISYTPEGRYEYDLPPKWQYFTPWAWASLGAWLGLIAAFWKLRGRKYATPVAGQAT